MKSYVSDKQIRLVGKVWEIRHQLQQMLQQGGPTVTVADYLAGMYVSQKHKSLGHPQRSRVIPFPLTNQ